MAARPLLVPLKSPGASSQPERTRHRGDSMCHVHPVDLEGGPGWLAEKGLRRASSLRPVFGGHVAVKAETWSPSVRGMA